MHKLHRKKKKKLARKLKEMLKLRKNNIPAKHVPRREEAKMAMQRMQNTRNKRNNGNDTTGMQTRLEAYLRIIPELQRRQEQVLKTIQESEQPLTNSEIAQKLKMRINCITPRTNELRKAGLITYAERRTCKVTGFKAMTLKSRTH